MLCSSNAQQNTIYTRKTKTVFYDLLKSKILVAFSFSFFLLPLTSIETPPKLSFAAKLFYSELSCDELQIA